MNLEYALKQLTRDKAISNNAIEGYKHNIINSLPPLQEFEIKPKKIKKNIFKRLISLFS